MLAALAEDFLALPGTRVEIFHDVRGRLSAPAGCEVRSIEMADQERQAFDAAAARADWTVVIAPEFDGQLAQRCQWVMQAGGRLLGCDAAAVALTADKHATAEHLLRHGVPAPRGRALEPFQPLPRDMTYPVVVKPRAGAGSQGVRRIEAYRAGLVTDGTPARLEPYCAGEPASVAVLCGPRGIVPLPPCRQRLGGESGFEYLGGEAPLPMELAQRATRLALAAVRCLPPCLGYLGVDLVLGADPSGSQDVVIEINPRLTTSYVGLRAIAETNLAAAMVAVAEGQTTELCWRPRAIQFDVSGRVRDLRGER